MTPLTYTLLADGPSDRCLLHVIDWLIGTMASVSQRGLVPQFCDSRAFAHRAATLAERMRQAIIFYPCDVLFVHRDAEREPMENRIREIAQAASEAYIPRHIPVIPVRMTEAWLLLDVAAIRRAADNPNGTVQLTLPRVADLEAVPDPKHLLEELLLKASEKRGRRLEQFRRDLPKRRARVAGIIADFSCLVQLPAFKHFAAEAKGVLDAWNITTTEGERPDRS